MLSIRLLSVFSFVCFIQNRMALVCGLQASCKTVWPLRGCRKRHTKRYGPCVAAASIIQNCMALAWLLQASYKTVWLLRGCCKRHAKLYGPCVAAASIIQNGMALAWLLQASYKTVWPLRGCRKHHAKLFFLRAGHASPRLNDSNRYGSKFVHKINPRFRDRKKNNYNHLINKT